MAHRDLALIAAFFPEAQHAGIAVIPQIHEPEFGDGTDAGSGISQHAQRGAFAQGHYIRRVSVIPIGSTICTQSGWMMTSYRRLRSSCSQCGSA